MDTRSKVVVPTAQEVRIPEPTRGPVDPRVRVSLLWIVYAVCMTTAFVLFLLSSEALGDVLAGRIGDMDITDGVTLMFAAFVVIPLVMAMLTLVLKDTANRWASGIVAGLLTISSIWDVVEHLSEGTFRGEALMMVLSVVVGLAIVWSAWRWRGVEARTTA